MARGSKKGDRRGGRTKGTPNRTTTEKALLAARQVAKAKSEGKPLATAVLFEFMHRFRDMALAHQHDRQFQKWARLTVDTAKMLAPFQSPTFRAIEQPAPPPDPKEEQGRARITLRVFESGKLVAEHGPEPLRVINGHGGGDG
jgi:hypothetical protein